jgi:hypothetical protein
MLHFSLSEARLCDSTLEYQHSLFYVIFSVLASKNCLSTQSGLFSAGVEPVSEQWLMFGFQSISDSSIEMFWFGKYSS